MDPAESEVEEVTSESESEAEDEPEAMKSETKVADTIKLNQETAASSNAPAENTDRFQTPPTAVENASSSAVEQTDRTGDKVNNPVEDSSSHAYEPLVSSDAPAQEPAADEAATKARSDSTRTSDSDGYTHLQHVTQETTSDADTAMPQGK